MVEGGCSIFKKKRVSPLQLKAPPPLPRLAKLQPKVDAFVANAATRSNLARGQASFRSNVPQYTVAVDRVKAETLHVSVDQVFAALAGYLGSRYVDQSRSASCC
jgi:multidrug efflux pump subunit AcrB